MKAKAKRVYAVEASELALPLKDVIKKNDAESVIKVNFLGGQQTFSPE